MDWKTTDRPAFASGETTDGSGETTTTDGETGSTFTGQADAASGTGETPGGEQKLSQKTWDVDFSPGPAGAKVSNKKWDFTREQKYADQPTGLLPLFPVCKTEGFLLDPGLLPISPILRAA